MTLFADGGAGAEELARKVIETIEKNPNPQAKPAYRLGDTLEQKINKVVCQVYGADNVTIDSKAQMAEFTKWGFGDLPICIAKNQYSRQSQTPGRPKRLEPHDHGCFLVRRSRICRRHLWKHDADVMPPKVDARLGD